MRINEIYFYKGSQRSQPVDITDLIENKSKFSSALAATPIFRGIKGGRAPFLFIEPANFTRYSRNTFNFGTLLMDNLPAWQKFPKRSQSIICSTSVNQAYGYTNEIEKVYRVLPFNNAKIGICPAIDVWLSFKQLSKYGIHLNHFNDEIVDVFRMVFPNKPLRDDTYANFIRDIRALSKALEAETLPVLESKLPAFYTKHSNFSGIFNILHAFKGEPLDKVIAKLFDPNLNGFSTSQIETFQIEEDGSHGGNEVWSDSPCYLVSQKIWDEVSEKLNAA